VVHIFASLRGFHHHRFRVDRVGLGPGRKLRLTLHLAWRQWLNDGYWGIGNTTAREEMYSGDFDSDDPRAKRYRYSLYQPFGHLTLRGSLSPRWSLFGALNVKYSVVRTYEGSLLAEQRPFGMDGGLGIILSAGIIYDSRAPEINPRSGVMAELSARYALPGGAGSFGGIFASIRGFYTPWSRLTLGMRVMVEALWGQIPFYEMVHWGGMTPVTGFGGFETLRGIAFGRFRAPGKAVLNAEARIKLFQHNLFKRPLAWQLGIFADLGGVFGANDNTPASGGPFVHPGGGAGVRLVYDSIFVMRVDAAAGLDPLQLADGSVKNEAKFGLYVVFDQAF
jgi:outer membrane protein assembly factor BamA